MSGGDPRNDPRANELLSADLGTINRLVIDLREVAGTAQMTAAGLRGARGDATWTGTAATAYRDDLGRFPAQLDMVSASYQEAGDALDNYEGLLSTVQPAFKSICQQYADAQTQLTNQTGHFNKLYNEVTADEAKDPSHATPLHLDDAYVKAMYAVDNTQNELSQLSNAGFKLLQEFEDGRSSAKGRVSSASQVPPRPSSPGAVSQFGNFMAGVGVTIFDGLVDAGKGLVNEVAGTITAAENFANHPSLSNFANLAGHVAIDGGIIVTAAGGLEAVGVVVDAGDGIDAAIVAGRVAKGASAAQAAAEVAEGKTTSGIIDGVMADVPDASEVFRVEKAAEEAIEQEHALSIYVAASKAGASSSEALDAVPASERQFATHALAFDNPEQNEQALADATEKAAEEQQQAARIATPLDAAAEKGKERLADGIKNALSGSGQSGQAAPAAC